MNKILLTIFRFLIIIILLAEISDWFFNYNDKTNQIIDAAMFSLTGIAYIAGGFIWNKKLTNVIFLICGIFLIVMNFIGDYTFKYVIGTLCILTPMIIVRFFPEETGEKELSEN